MPREGWTGVYKKRKGIHEIWDAPLQTSKPEGLRVGPLLHSLAAALAPAGANVITAVFEALVPVMEQIGVRKFPTSYNSLRNKYGFKDFFDKNISVGAYCPGSDCGRLQRTKPEDRERADKCKRHLCQYCETPTYIQYTCGSKQKFVPARSDHFFDAYRQAVDMMDTKTFDALYAEQWADVKVVLDDPEAPQHVYSDWLNEAARAFFIYVRDTHGDIIKFDPADEGCIFLFQKQLSDYMSMSGNVRSSRGEKTYGAFCTENLSLPKRVRSQKQYVHPYQIYNDGSKIKNTLRRQEMRSLLYNDWRAGRRMWLPKRKIWRTVHLTLLFEQADWLVLEEILLWMNFKNQHWAWFAKPLRWIKAFASASHRYYPQHIPSFLAERGA